MQHFVWLTKCPLGGQDERLLPIARVERVIVLVSPDEVAPRPRDFGDKALAVFRIRLQLDQVVE